MNLIFYKLFINNRVNLSIDLFFEKSGVFKFSNYFKQRIGD